ncbi:sensor domain-containing protein [Mycobacterium sp.]|uniref:sensor domain-containing protein n=1 Tax=Mycobacterium sp. TaxID=1785 RepID=UPI003F9C9ADA
MIPTSWVLRGGVLVAVLVGAAPVGACETRVNHADPPRAVDQLASMLADESAINAIMGTTALRVYYTYRALPGWPEGDVYSRPECMPQIANAMKVGYHGSHYGQVRGARLADDRPSDARSIDEAVVAFDSGSAAQTFVAATVQSWRACADAVLTITSANRAPERWNMGSPRVVNGVQVVDADDPDSTSGWRTSHAMRAADNVVIDVRVTDYAVSDQAVRVVNAIAGGNPL